MEFDDTDEPIELGEPDELPMYNQAVNTIKALRARVAELESERHKHLNEIRDLNEKVRIKDIKIAELKKLVQQHQTYQTKQGWK